VDGRLFIQNKNFQEGQTEILAYLCDNVTALPGTRLDLLTRALPAGNKRKNGRFDHQ
jgi:hypothetical protein